MVVRAEPFAFLSTLQAWQLKRLAFLSGLNTSGTKQLLHGKLANSLSKPSLPAPKCRVLSVDMGVKNLAFCLLDLQQIPQHAGDADARYNDSTLSLHVADWKRLNVSQRFGDKSAGSTAGLVDDVRKVNRHDCL
jgi:cruciform cutting endonuclease 1